MCDGKGYAYVGTAPNPITRYGYKRICDKCHGTGEIEQTNDEWRRTCSTEEFADFLMRVFKNCTWCLDGGSPQDCPFNEFLDCPAESKENMVKWLKKIHESEGSDVSVR